MEALPSDPLDAAILRWLTTLSEGWQKVELLNLPRSEAVALQSCVFSGLVELQTPATAWTDDLTSRVRVTFFTQGAWSDTSLINELRTHVPGWTEKRVSVQQDTEQFARLTSDGRKAQSEVLSDGPELFRFTALLAAKANPQPPKIRCRIENFADRQDTPTAAAQATASVGDITVNVNTGPSAETPSDSEPDATEQEKSGRRRGRGIEVERFLERYLSDRAGVYQGLVPVILSGDAAAQREFRDQFGPTTIAGHLCKQQGTAEYGQEMNRIKKAIQETRLYRDRIKPLLAKPPRAPKDWRPRDKDGHDDIINQMRRQAKGG